MSRRAADDRQYDLFLAHLTDLPLRDQRDTMERPFFSLGKRKRVKPIEYAVGDVQVKVSAPADIGLATIWDADILIFLASQINEAREKGLEHSPRMFFRGYDLLLAVHRGTGGKEYIDLRAALKRLTATVVETNIRADDGHRTAIFHWLERVDEHVDQAGHSKGFEIQLPSWLYDGIIASHVLAIAPEYFDITSGMKRWLYRVVRKHAGNQDAGWNFTLRQLHTKSGSTQPYGAFARDLRRAVQANDLPEYHVNLYDGDRGDECIHAVRRTLLAPNHPAYDADVFQQTGKRRTRPRQ